MYFSKPNNISYTSLSYFHPLDISKTRETPTRTTKGYDGWASPISQVSFPKSLIFGVGYIDSGNNSIIIGCIKFNLFNSWYLD